MKGRDFLHLAIAGTAAASARRLFAREQQAGPVGANSRIRAAIADSPGAPPWVVQNLRIFRR